MTVETVNKFLGSPLGKFVLIPIVGVFMVVFSTIGLIVGVDSKYALANKAYVDAGDAQTRKDGACSEARVQIFNLKKELREIEKYKTTSNHISRGDIEWEGIVKERLEYYQDVEKNCPKMVH